MVAYIRRAGPSVATHAPRRNSKILITAHKSLLINRLWARPAPSCTALLIPRFSSIYSMSGRIDSAGGPASPVSIEGLSGSENAEAFELDHSYVKANRKGELKFTKLNFDNYQNWADGMKILLSVNMMWPLVNEITKQFGSLKSIDRMEWLADDVQAKAWIYTNLKNSQHNHIKEMTTANAMWKTLKKMHDAFDQGRLNFLKKNSSTTRLRLSQSMK